MPWILGTRNSLAAGQRDKAVEIQAGVKGREASGFPTETWVTLDTVMMSRRDVSGVERFTAHQETASAITQWAMSYLASMDPDLVDVPATRRLKWSGRVFDIQVATLMERRVGIELTTLSASGTSSR